MIFVTAGGVAASCTDATGKPVQEGTHDHSYSAVSS